MSPKTIGEHLKQRRLDLNSTGVSNKSLKRTSNAWLSVSNWKRGVNRPAK